MQLIYKTAFRELSFNKKRTFLSFLVTLIIVAFPISMVSIDPSINESVDGSNNNYQLAHLDIRFQGDEEEIRSSVESLKESNPKYNSISFDIRPTTDFQVYQNSKWYLTSVVGVNTTNPPTVNQFKSDNDVSELQDNKAFILESFAKELNVEIGDSITLYTPSGKKLVEISSIVKSIEFLSYELSLTGAIYINYNTFQEFNNWSTMQFNSAVFYFPDNPNLKSLKDFTDILYEEVSPSEAQIIYPWYVREFSNSSKFQEGLTFTSQLLFLMACAIIIAAGIVIYLITKRYAVEQRKQTGMLYAYGFSSKTIMKVFMLRTFIISIFAIIAGTIISFGILQIMMHSMVSMWGIPMMITKLSPIALYIVPALVILTTQLFTYFASISNVKMTPYEAIRGKAENLGEKKKKKKQNKSKKKLSSFLPIQLKYPLRNIGRNRKRGILITSAFIGAIAISFALIQTQTSINGTFTNYFNDQIQWDMQVRFNNFQSPSGIETIFENNDFIEKYEPHLYGNAEVINQTKYELIIKGIQPNSTLYSIDLREGALFSNETAQEGIISSYSAKPLGLKVGDYLEFKLLETEFRIKIVGIARDLDLPTSCFMLLPAIEQTTGFSAINGAFIQLKNREEMDSTDIDSVLLELNEHPQIQYTLEKNTFKYQTIHMVNTQLFVVEIIIVLSLIISFLIIFVTGYITIIERTREIALQRCFGFKKGQIVIQIILELGILIFLAVIFGVLLGGEILGRFIHYMIGKFFFDLDFIYFWKDYSTIIGFAIGSILLSTMPSIKLLNKQHLATAIIE